MPSNDAYEIVAAELNEQQVDPAMWARAIAETGADDARAKARYIKLRAARIEELAQTAYEEQVAQKVERTINAAVDKTKDGLSVVWLIIQIIVFLFILFMVLGSFVFEK